MTKPTVTQYTTKYALFRRGVLEHTVDYALQGNVYNSYLEAKLAMSDLQNTLSIGLRNSIEIQVIDGTLDEQMFGKNPLAWYYE
jgi:hypothetical protein